MRVHTHVCVRGMWWYYATRVPRVGLGTCVEVHHILQLRQCLDECLNQQLVSELETRSPEKRCLQYRHRFEAPHPLSCALTFMNTRLHLLNQTVPLRKQTVLVSFNLAASFEIIYYLCSI